MYDVMRHAHNMNALDGAAQPGEGSTAGMAMLRGGLQLFFFKKKNSSAHRWLS